MNTRSRNSRYERCAEEAAEWFIDFRDGAVDAAGRHEFNTWIRTSPEHIRAYLETAAIWDRSVDIDVAHRYDVDALIALASERGNVVELGTPGERAAQPSAPGAMRGANPARVSHRRARFALAAGLGIMLLLGGVIASVFLPARAQVYSTGVGEQRSFPLEDGSRIELNSRSEIKVHFTAQVRTVELVRGQALFRVAPQPKRPFVVRSGGLRAQAVGTLFDVNLKRTATVVTVVEGKVAVASLAAQAGRGADTGRSAAASSADAGPAKTGVQLPNEEVLLSAGQQAIASPTAARLRLAAADVAAATAWTQQKLVFEDVPLQEVVEEFNRYSPRPFVIRGTTPDELRLSGIFSTDPAFLLSFLQDRPDITVRETDAEILLIQHEPGSP